MGKKKDSLEDMKDEALRRQDNLAADIDELLDRVNPVNAFQRWKNEAKDSTKSFFVADSGAVKPVPVAGLVGGALGLLAVTAGAIVLVTRTPKDGIYYDRDYSKK
ncbi:hypothetical protein M3B90_04460 [Dermabacter sp. p3-SID358]|uniref:hypothetical protein n=1 Tax=Dermabacter sp. p3-SID358 TaxID=2916114 RepID=UPI0021A809F6|nr:hypothetical protein [Dermabacter sp. p3-SID358]MCT1866776.1 hypothetical protein [Dermabacter sp. p3-SID358]